jgi:uncharacterized membrane protein HdeD (DUF308 family)
MHSKKMNKKTLKIFLGLGLLSFIGGIILIFNFNISYGIGFMTLGAMWTMISFGKMRMIK